MKYFFTIFLSLCATSAWSVQMKHCPESIKIELSQFSILAHDQIDDKFWELAGPDRPEVELSYEHSKNMPAFSARLTLKSKAGSQCYYTHYSLPDQITFVSATLKGPHTGPSLKLKFTAQPFNSDVEVTYISYFDLLPKFNENNLAEANSEASLYVDLYYCSMGECLPRYFRIGSALKVKLNPTKIERVKAYQDYDFYDLPEGELLEKIKRAYRQSYYWEDEGRSCGGQVSNVEIKSTEKVEHEIIRINITAIGIVPIDYCRTTAPSLCHFRIDKSAHDNKWIVNSVDCDILF